MDRGKGGEKKGWKEEKMERGKDGRDRKMKREIWRERKMKREKDEERER